MQSHIQMVEEKMKATLEALKREFQGIRTGRANPAILDGIFVNAYGSKMPLNQVGNINVPDARLLTVQVWDKSMVKTVEKAILDSNLGINPVTEGEVIRLPMPDLSEERRKDYVKLVAKHAEAARVSLRNVRRDGIDSLKKMEKDKTISEDDLHRGSTKIQDVTDKYVKLIDEAALKKEQDIMHI
ncbi:MAG: ribosome recycling factor [Alphaproteobacteria bacterium]|jgi:ribosome recycling factor|nr:ribosome recycling factor [Alphaproteobacteria bacterium]